MGCPENNEVGPEEQKCFKKPSKEEVRQALAARGYTEIDFEVMEARANRTLEEMHVRKVVNRFKFDFSHLEKPGM